MRLGVAQCRPATQATQDAYDLAEAMRASVEVTLRELPEEPYEIARHLANLHIRGVCHDGYDCALGVLLEASAGIPVFVHPDWVSIPVLNAAGYQVSHVDASVPPNVSRFIDLFDAGCFPRITREDVSLV